MRIIAPMRLSTFIPLIILLFAAALPARAQSPVGNDVPVEERNPSVQATRLPAGSEVVVHGLSYLDTPYRYGGQSRDSGIDCSALVQQVFAEALELKLPRTTRGLSRTGQKISRKDLQTGDLVFFNTRRRAYSHVGIYVGNGRFLHAPSKGGKVRIERLNVRYWSKRFNGGRRVIEPPTQLTAASPSQRTHAATPSPL